MVVTMSYKAKLLKDVSRGYKKGQTVVVTRDLKKNWVLRDGTVIPDKSYINLTKQLYNPECRYRKAEAE